MVSLTNFGLISRLPEPGSTPIRIVQGDSFLQTFVIDEAAVDYTGSTASFSVFDTIGGVIDNAFTVNPQGFEGGVNIIVEQDPSITIDYPVGIYHYKLIVTRTSGIAFTEFSDRFIVSELPAL